MPEALTEERIAAFRSQICDVAVAQFTRDGIDRVSMRNLARELGYSATALYSYYRNKDEILAAARTTCVNRLCDELAAALDARQEPSRRCIDFIDAYLAFASDQAPSYSLAFALDQPAPSRYPPLADALARVREHFAHFVSLSLPEVLARDKTSPQRAWALLHGAVALAMCGASRERPRGKGIYETLVGSLMGHMDEGPAENQKNEAGGGQMTLGL